MVSLISTDNPNGDHDVGVVDQEFEHDAVGSRHLNSMKRPGGLELLNKATPDGIIKELEECKSKLRQIEDKATAGVQESEQRMKDAGITIT